MRSIDWLGDAVRFIDQSRLPDDEIVVTTADPEVLADAIRTLKLRGAPLIGISAAYGIALAAMRFAGSDPPRFQEYLATWIHTFRATRPTAVNLFWAIDRMERAITPTDTPSEITARLVREAITIHTEDADACTRLANAGQSLVPDGASIITHCNTGALATGGDGTALAVLLAAHRNGKRIHIFIDETRPALQGARLTTWECRRAGIPSTLITDSTAASVMREKAITLVIVGADRIASNGDVANKIGTYSLAVLANHHGIPMYVAAPSSTIDSSILSGEQIVIEERSPAEVLMCGAGRVAPEGFPVYAPAFDRTPAGLITAIITEHGIHRPPYDFSAHRREGIHR